jgi:cob(I)alamin adenosyltransferase
MEVQFEEKTSNSLKKGYVQVYTGNGKGKTTAAIGLAVRAAGAGLRVFFAQFIKGMLYSEIEALERFSELITVRQYGRGCFIDKNPEQQDIEAAHHGLDDIEIVMECEDYDVIILDEANVAVQCNLITADELLELINKKPFGTELIITGRYAKKEILAVADLVTEMKEVKHYYQKGILARTGIEK